MAQSPAGPEASKACAKGFLKASVTNDLQAPIEVKLEVSMGHPEVWQVVYPGRSLEVEAVEFAKVSVRLREALGVVGHAELRAVREGCWWCCGRGVGLQASRDFGPFGREALERDRLEQQGAEREAVRRKVRDQRRDDMTQQEAFHRIQGKRINYSLTELCVRFGLTVALAIVLVLLCASIQPGDGLAAGLLSAAVLPPCIYVSCMCAVMGVRRSAADFFWESYGCLYSTFVRIAWALGLVALVFMTVRNSLMGHWWTAFILWPLTLCCSGIFNRKARARGAMFANSMKVAVDDARKHVLRRSIVFKGGVLPGAGRPCVCSWPGKYEEAWETLVELSRAGDLSAAVVFLPEGTRHFGTTRSLRVRSLKT